MISIIQEGNLVPVPPELAHEFGLHEGSRVDWERSENGSWTLRPAKSRSDIADELFGAGAKFVKPGESGVENFLRLRDEEAQLDGGK